MRDATDVLLKKGLPADVGAEKLILGAMLNGQSGANVIGVMQVSDFSLEKHRRIFDAMMHLEANGLAIDRVTVAHELQRRELLESVDGLTYLVSLDEGMPEIVNLDAYVSIVRDKAVLRKAITEMQSAISECLMAADPTHEILDRAERTLTALGSETRSVSFRNLKEVLDRAGGLSAIVNPDKGSCVGTPWPLLNRMLMSGGFMAGQMIVIGARPSMGKTAMACQVADFAASAGVGVAFFTLEMPDQAILLRMAAARAQVDSLKVTQRSATESERQALGRAFAALTDPKSCPLWIDDTTACTVPAMRRALRKLTARQTIGLVVMDYLQLVETCGGGRNRYEQISEISRGVKRLAREFNVPVVVLAQLNRESEKEARQPRLSDLRDSGSIEQDADIILMPSRRPGQDEQSDSLAIDLLIAKQRNGPRCSVPLTFLRRYAKFIEGSTEAQVA